MSTEELNQTEEVVEKAAADAVQKEEPLKVNLLELLGKDMVDQVTGFAGVATAVVFYITGIPQIRLQPKVNLANSPALIEAQWFDVSRLAEDKDYSPTSGF